MTKYKVPNKIASMTIHHLYGISKAEKQTNIKDYLESKHFALTADLLAQGFKPADIERAVNSGDIYMAHWPIKNPLTDMYWVKNKTTLQKLEDLAEEATRFCKDVPGNFVTVGAEMGSQQMALVGLIYAREQGKLSEISQLSDQGTGPTYVKKGSIFESILSRRK